VWKLAWLFNTSLTVELKQPGHATEEITLPHINSSKGLDSSPMTLAYNMKLAVASLPKGDAPPEIGNVVPSTLAELATPFLLMEANASA